MIGGNQGYQVSPTETGSIQPDHGNGVQGDAALCTDMLMTENLSPAYDTAI